MYYTILCFKNLFLRRYAYVLCNVSLNTPVACSLVCFFDMTSSLAKVNKSSGAHFLALFLKFPNFLMFLNIQIDLLISKTYYGQFTLTTKKSLHIIFKGSTRLPSGVQESSGGRRKDQTRTLVRDSTLFFNEFLTLLNLSGDIFVQLHHAT